LKIRQGYPENYTVMSSPFSSRGGDNKLYGSLSNSNSKKKSVGRKTASMAPATTKFTHLVSTTMNPKTTNRSYSTDSTTVERTRRRKSRAISSRSRLLLLPSFAETWRVEQSLLMSSNDNGDPTSSSHSHLEQSTWFHATGIIVGEILGSGVLGLPGAFSNLGYVLGTLCCVTFCFFAIYSGVILAKVRNEFFPTVERYADAAKATGSSAFASFTRWAVHLNWLFLLPYYLMTIAHSLQLGLSSFVTLCFYEYTFIAAGVLLIFLQFRTLSGLAYAAMLSDAAIIVAIIMILVSITSNDGTAPSGSNHTNATSYLYQPIDPIFSASGSVSASSSSSYSSFTSITSPSSFLSSSSPSPSSTSTNTTSTNPWWPSSGTFLQVYGRTSTIVFAFQGQSIYYEIMREMKDSRDFSKAVTVANSFMGGIYLITCLIVTIFSHKYLHTVPDFLPNAIPVTDTISRTVVGLLLSYHVTISYILNNQPLSNALHAMTSPETLLDYDTWKGRIIWCSITTTLLIFSILVANTIPFFSTFQSLVGSLMGAPLMFGWPAYFYWKSSWNQDGYMKRMDVFLCLLFLFVFLPLCTVLGTVSAIQALLNDWSTSGLPFQCQSG